MREYVICEKQDLVDIASAVREKTGSTDNMVGISGIKSEIDGIEDAQKYKDILYGLIERSSELTEMYDEQITIIGQCAFMSCSSLESIDFPACTTVGYSAFANCWSLENVNLPVCTTVRISAFYGCRMTNVNLSACTIIESGAFLASGLEEAIFPVCTQVGGAAFTKCTSLKIVDLPACSKFTDYAAPFADCRRLTSVNLPVLTSMATCFPSCSSLKDVNIPACTYLSNSFMSCTSLTNIDLPACTTIGNSTFYNCTSLTNIDLPVCTNIGSYAFYKCTSLKNIDLPVCTSIGNSAFYNCTSLESVNLPACTSIGNSAFYNCSKIMNVTLSGSSIAYLGSSVFLNTPMSRSTYTGSFGSIYVPANLVSAYKTATNWSVYANRIVANSATLTSIDDIICLFETTKNISIKWRGIKSDDTISNVSIVSSDPTIVTIDSISTSDENIIFNVISLSKEGKVTITVSATIGEDTISTSFDITVFEELISTYAVQEVSDAQYGFTLNDNGYFESQNKAKNSTAALCKIAIISDGTSRLYLDCINYAESNYDYGILSVIDKTLSTTSSADTSNVFKSFKGLQSADVQTVDYGIIPSGEHFIYVKYIKDSSQNENNDTLQFKVRFEAE